MAQNPLLAARSLGACCRRSLPALPRADAACAVELAAAEGSAAPVEPPADVPPAEAACAELRTLLKQAEEVLARGKARPDAHCAAMRHVS